MAEAQDVHLINDVWPADVAATSFRFETPYKLLDGKAGRFARALWWLLKKMNVLKAHYETEKRWVYVPRGQDDLHRVMMKAVEGNLARAHDQSVVFIIGGKTFHDLVQSPVFSRAVRLYTGPFGYRHEIFDIPIHIVPWMTGLAVVPAAFIEKESKHFRELEEAARAVVWFSYTDDDEDVQAAVKKLRKLVERE